MELDNVGNIRLCSQHVSYTSFKTAKEIVARMGAVQAQDYNMAKWALGVRLPGSTDEVIQAAIDSGEILRTHVLRPTWHLVSADDIYWMLDLTAARIKQMFGSRYRELSLNPSDFTKANKIIEKTLGGGTHLIREDLFSEFKKAKIITGDNRGSHLLLHAELDGLICSGTSVNNKQSYALLEERVARPKPLIRDEALARLARRYFLSHGPATVYDFSWWSGLSLTEARKSLDFVKSGLISETIGPDTFWFSDECSRLTTEKPAVVLLPAFDEFIISYKNRSASLLADDHKKAVSSNGLFRPVIVVNGKVTGLWTRVIKKDRVIIEADFFHPPTKSIKRLLESSANTFGHFLGKQAEVVYA